MEVYLSKLYTLIVFGDATPSVPSFIGSKVIFWWISCVRSAGHISWQISFTFCTDVHHSQIYTPVCFGDAAPSQCSVFYRVKGQILVHILMLLLVLTIVRAPGRWQLSLPHPFVWGNGGGGGEGRFVPPSNKRMTQIAASAGGYIRIARQCRFLVKLYGHVPIHMGRGASARAPNYLSLMLREKYEKYFVFIFYSTAGPLVSANNGIPTGTIMAMPMHYVN